MKYLEVKIDEHLNWKPHIDGISAKLNKANAMLPKIRPENFKSNLPCYIRITLTFFFFSLATQF